VDVAVSWGNTQKLGFFLLFVQWLAEASDFKLGRPIRIIKDIIKIITKEKNRRRCGLVSYQKVWVYFYYYCNGWGWRFQIWYTSLAGLSMPVMKSHREEKWAWIRTFKPFETTRLSFLQWLKMSTSNLVRTLASPRPIMKSHREE